MPQRVLLSVVAAAGVLAGVMMVLLGLPEATAVQSILLELSSLPLSVSVAAGVALLHSTAARPVGPRSRRVLAGGGVAAALGLLLMCAAYLVGPRSLVHLGQVLVWLGLLAALVVMIRRQPRRRATRLSLLDPEPGEERRDPAADRDSGPSL